MSGGESGMRRPLEILHLEDSKLDATLIEREIRKNFPESRITLVEREKEFRDALTSRIPFDIILSDYRLGPYDGNRALLLARELRPETPFIMVTGELGEDRAVETLKHGAWDYVLKDNLKRLTPCIERALRDADKERDRRRGERSRIETNRRLQLLSDLSSDFLHADYTPDFVEKIYRRLSDELGFEIYFHYLFDEEEQTLSLANYTGATEAEIEVVKSLPLGQGVCGTAAKRREPVVVEHVQQAVERMVAVIKSLGITAFVAFPLIVANDLIGTFSFGTRTRERFTESELTLMQTVSDQIAIAILRQRSEDALRLNEERYRTLASATSTAIWRVAPDGKKLLSMVGAGFSIVHPEEGLEITPWLSYVHPDDRERSIKGWMQAVATRTKYEIEHRVLQADGAYHFFLTRAVPLSNERGEVIEWIGSSEDITGIIEGKEYTEASPETAAW